MNSKLIKAFNEFRFQQASKVALACVIDALIVNWFHLPLGFFAAIGSFVIMTVFHDQTIRKGIERIVGPALMTVAAIVILNVSQLWLFYMILMVIILLIGSYMFFREKFPYAALMGAIIGSVVLMEAIQTPEPAIQLGINFVKVTIVGVVVAWFVTWLIWPVKKSRYIYPRLYDLLDNLPKILRGKKKVNSGDFSQLVQVLEYAKAEMVNEQSYYNHINFILRLKQLYVKFADYRKNLAELKKTSLYKADQEKIDCFLTEFVTQLINQYQQLTENFKKKRINKLDDTLVQLVAEFELYLNKQRQVEAFKTYPIKEVLELFALIGSSQAIISDLLETQIAIEVLIGNKKTSQIEAYAKEVEDNSLLPIDVTALKRSIKITLAIIAMLILHYYFGWYSGIQAVITVTVILAQPNIGRAQHRGLLRFAGVIIGGVVGFVGLLILSVFTHFYFLLAYLFFSILIFDYVALSGERYGYAGLQAAVMMPLILLATNTFDVTLTIPLHRFVGVIQGLIIATVISLLLWPDEPIKQLKLKLAAGLNNCRTLFKQSITIEETRGRGLRRQIEQALLTKDSLVYDANCVVGRDSQDKNFLKLVNLIESFYLNIIMLSKLLHSENNDLILYWLNDFSELFNSIDSCLLKMINALRQENSKAHAVVKLDNVLIALLEEQRASAKSKEYSEKEVECYAGFAGVLHRILQDLGKVDKVIQQLNKSNLLITKKITKAGHNEAV